MTDIPGWILNGILKASREVMEERDAAPLIGLFGDEKKVFTEGERDAVWRHLSENGICCARATKRDKRPDSRDMHCIIIARDDTALAAHMREVQKLIEDNNLVGKVSMDLIRDA